MLSLPTPLQDSRVDARPKYPARLLQRVVDLTGFSYRLSALDLSNDAGTLAVELARLARTVTVALDSDSISYATADTLRRHGARVQLRFGGLAAFVAEGARYFLVTMGRTLRERDGASLLSSIEPLVDRGGAVVVLGTRYPCVAENAWRHQLQRRHALERDDVDEGLLLDSRFDLLERVTVFERSTLTVEEALSQQRSFASGRLDSLRARLLKHVNADGLLSQVVEGHALIARRQGDRSGRWS